MICTLLRRTALCWLLLVLIVPAQSAPLPALSYNRDIRPILSDNCFFCHGPDERKRKAKLRLDLREEAVRKKAIVPGQADESELVRRIFSSDPDELMPPAKSQKVLTSAQKELLRRWIESGAEYQGHWAYLSPKRPEGPSGSAAIDELVEKRLAELGLTLAPQADRRTLMRRLHVDLTGLPPKPEDVHAFEQDPLSGAVQELVERLLASPAYGERMAIGWLDVARFADTIGYHSDNPRNIWPYRDYVIHAFNSNKPFDRFTREQLAGDLLPASTLEQKVASGFNRLLLSTEEGGAQPKDYEARMLGDRVRAVGSVWLAQTIGCAQCHDHKFDPITSRDFYSMGAFFADIREPIIGRREDGMLVPTSAQAAELARLDKEVARAKELFETPHPSLLAAWERAAMEAIALDTHWVTLRPEEARAESGVPLKVDLEGKVTAEKTPAKGTDVYRLRVKPNLSGIVGFRLEALPAEALPSRGPGRGQEGGFAVSQIKVESDHDEAVELADAIATSALEEGTPLPAIQADRTNGGWIVRTPAGAPQTLYFSTAAPLDTADDRSITITLFQNAGDNQVLGRFRLAATQDPDAIRAPRTPVPPREIVQILNTSATPRSDEQQKQLAAYHRSIAPELSEARQRLASAQKKKDQFEATIPRTLVSSALETPRPVRILPRGNWMNETGDIVQPAVPAFLAGPLQSATNRHLTRLDLAEWIVAPENPLTARVFVNRLWKQFFGIGLSKVPDDFGAQGEPPVNQALLDWLACEFRESGWDVKHMVRLIVNSRTYRQASIASKELQLRDPDNRLVARQGRWRLEAELIRDNALSIAELLQPRIGGPSVKPYQPDGYWENLNFPIRTYEASSGPDQYRRGLYTWWQRSYLHPSLVAFDAPTREECAAERTRSNIPQQALVLLNDPSYVEAARAFAGRILIEGGAQAKDRINWAWQQVLARAPRAAELEVAESLVSKHLTEYKAMPEMAARITTVGQQSSIEGLDPAELAAWTSLARVLLNLHETVTRS